MTVAVVFPDGTIRNVMGMLKRDGQRFVQCPINCNPQWKYLWRAGRWVATRRNSKVRALALPEHGAWWETIPQMADGSFEISPDTAEWRNVG
ncbi:MAG: hypothetical protein V4461_03675 [Pseudomonadota bacterium]